MASRVILSIIIIIMVGLGTRPTIRIIYTYSASGVRLMGFLDFIPNTNAKLKKMATTGLRVY